jgi:phage shock protein PspC (stress-responsive transcriptional regulator)
MSRRRCGSIVAAMTETTTAPGPLGAPRLLYRDPNDGMFAGVCAAVGRYTDTDPVIWRIVTVVLTVFGGVGAILYLVGWLLIPKIGEDRSIGETWLQRRGHDLSGKTVAIIAVIAVIALGGLDHGHGAAAVAVVGLVAYLVYRERHDRPVAPSYSAPPAAVAAPGGPPPPPMVRVPRERSRLGLLTVSVAALVGGVLAWASSAGADWLTPARITAIALLIVGAGLVVGTWYGRARWLIVVGLLLSLGLGTAAAADATGGTLRGGVGSRTWVVTQGPSNQAFTLGIGEARLDLTGVPPSGPHVVVHSKVGLGHLIIVVPDGVPIRIHAKLRIGDLSEFGHSLDNGDGPFDRTRTYGSGDPRIEVEATLGTGQIEVRHG